MNEKDFEKQDQSFKEAFHKFQNEKIPEGVLKNFDEEVRKKILSSGPQGFPVLGIVAGLVLVSALGFGLFFWPRTVNHEPTAQTKLAIESSKITPQGDVEILDEIAALTELGLWSEEDDEALGIDLSASLQELNSILESATPHTPGVGKVTYEIKK